MKKAKKIAVSPAAGPNTDINVTPLVDVVLVLLIIFMVVTPLLEKDIAVSVPNTEKVEQVEEVPQDQLVVKLMANGDLLLNGNKIEESEYVGQLETVFKKKPNPRDRIVFILAEDGASYGRLVHLFDGARKAGADTLGLMTDDLDKK
ncbi:MAG: biopolymer transporter ExbD [Polyangiaceae bacterium]|nr:biopolymer transporter ExbD [Polyangiaceae bacterium]